jgi:exodeoxyribonuclease VII small subunit
MQMQFNMTQKQLLEGIKKLDFESSLKKLEEIVEQIENSQNGLEKSIEDYEYGIALKNHLFQKLENAKVKIERISELDNKES